MTAFDVVRFRVRPGCKAAFIAAQRASPRDFAGIRRFVLIKTGERA